MSVGKPSFQRGVISVRRDTFPVVRSATTDNPLGVPVCGCLAASRHSSLLTTVVVKILREEENAMFDADDFLRDLEGQLEILDRLLEAVLPPLPLATKENENESVVDTSTAK